MTELAAPEGDPTATRWRRFGHDRVYVRAADGTDLGFWDLASDQAHPAEERWLPLLTTAVVAWRASDAPTPRLVVAEPEPEPEPAPDPGPVAERPWVDLSANAPGELARERALAERGAAPVRTLLARVLDLKTDERSWRLGAVGEAKVGKRLARLTRADPRWHALHAIPVGDRGSDIDHLVIGPGGVFTLNAKHHPDRAVKVCGNTIYVDGHRTDYVRNSRFESDRAAKLLTAACGFPVAVEAVVVTVNAASVEVRNQPAGVHVVDRMQLVRWLQRLGESLDDERVAAVHEAARRSTTWQP